MGLIAVLKNLVRATRKNGTKVNDYVCDIGGAEFVTAEGFGTPGDDSAPLTSDLMFILPASGTGRAVCLGFIDPKAEQLAQAGERRLYSRNAGGARVAQVWIKADGAIKIENASGSWELRPDGSNRAQNASGYHELGADGTLDANGTIIAPNGDITCPGKITAQEIAAPSIKAAGLELAGHKHSNGTAGDGNTGVNLP